MPRLKPTISAAAIIHKATTTSEIKIQSSELRIEKVEIYDVLGQKYNSAFYILNSEFVVYISQLAPGIYFVRVRTENGIAAGKFIKQ